MHATLQTVPSEAGIPDVATLPHIFVLPRAHVSLRYEALEIVALSSICGWGLLLFRVQLARLGLRVKDKPYRRIVIVPARLINSEVLGDSPLSPSEFVAKCADIFAFVQFSSSEPEKWKPRPAQTQPIRPSHSLAPPPRLRQSCQPPDQPSAQHEKQKARCKREIRSKTSTLSATQTLTHRLS